MNKAKLGDRVKVQYLGLLRDGSGTQTRRGRQVLEFTVGDTKVMRGISLGVVGMAEGQEKRLTVQPKDGYGTVRRKLIKEIPRQRFPSHLKLSVGKQLTSIGVTSGRRRQVHVVEIKQDTVVVDGNHPLAGKVLDVEIQLVSLHPSPSATGNAQ